MPSRPMFSISVLTVSISSSRPGSPRTVFSIGGRSSTTSSEKPWSANRVTVRCRVSYSHQSSTPQKRTTAVSSPSCLAIVHRRSGRGGSITVGSMSTALDCLRISVFRSAVGVGRRSSVLRGAVGAEKALRLVRQPRQGLLCVLDGRLLLRGVRFDLRADGDPGAEADLAAERRLLVDA